MALIPTQAKHCSSGGIFHQIGNFYRRDIGPVQGPNSRPRNIEDHTPNLLSLLKMYWLGTKQFK